MNLTLMDTAVTIVAAGGVGRLEAVALVKNLGLQKRMAISWMWLYDTTPGRVHTDWSFAVAKHLQQFAWACYGIPQQGRCPGSTSDPTERCPMECGSARRKTTVHCTNGMSLSTSQDHCPLYQAHDFIPEEI